MNVLITGALGGIGKAVTNYFIKKGLTVYAIDVLDDCTLPGVNYYKGDITDKNSLNSILEKLKANGVILDAIINVAGIFYIDSFIEISDENLKKIFDINLMGAMLVNKTFYPLLSKKGKILIDNNIVVGINLLREGIDIPEVYVYNDPVMNAFTYGETNPFVCISSSCVEKLTDDELVCFMAHECGHILCKHTLYNSVVNLIQMFGERMGIITRSMSQPIYIALQYWSRQSEYSADRCGAFCHIPR